MNARAKALIASVVVIALALTAVSGVTYSWFSDTEKTDVSVDGARFDLNTTFGPPTVVNSSIGTSATVDSVTGEITVSNLAPGSIVTIPYSAEYTSTIDVMYSLKATVSDMVLKDYDMENISVCGKSIKTIVGAGSSGDLAVVDWTSMPRTAPAIAYGTYQPLGSGNIVISALPTYGDSPATGWSVDDARSFKVVITAELTQGDRPVTSLDSGIAVIPSSNKTVSGQAEAVTGAIDMDATVDFSAVSSVTPASSSASVEPAGLTVSVKSVSPGVTGFSVNALGTISLALSGSAGPISSPTFDQPVVVTAVLKNVTSDPGVVQVKYGADNIDVISYMYDSTAKTLTVVFKTNHFSDFDIVPAKVRNGSDYYASLADAVGKAKAGDTLVLVGDTKEAADVVKVDKNLTIELNDHEITFMNDGLRVQGTSSEATATLTINGEGKIVGGKVGTANFEDLPAYAMSYGTLIINGGEFVSNSCAECIYAGENATVEINGGVFSSTKPTDTVKGWLLNAKDSSETAKIVVKGGTFHGYSPANGDNTNGGTFVSDGYLVEESVSNTYAVVKAPVKIGDKYYASLSDAIKAATKDAVIEIIFGTQMLENDVANQGDKARTVTIQGDGTQTVDVITKAVSAEDGMLSYQRGSTFTFKNLNIKAGEGSFDGIVCDGLVFENCIITGKLTLYGKATFTNCTFENTMANQYSIWTWGGTDVKFENCTFNTNGKAILLYGRATADKPTNLTVTDCTFTDRNNGVAGKAAIEIGNDYTATYNLVINNIIVNGFADGKNTGSKVWANKNSMDAEHLSVTIDGDKVQ